MMPTLSFRVLFLLAVMGLSRLVPSRLLLPSLAFTEAALEFHADFLRVPTGSLAMPAATPPLWAPSVGTSALASATLELPPADLDAARRVIQLSPARPAQKGFARKKLEARS